jgi:hypothetical protein
MGALIPLIAPFNPYLSTLKVTKGFIISRDLRKLDRKMKRITKKINTSGTQ